MKICLVITDSVGFPRTEPLTLFQNTWLGLLEEKLNQSGFFIVYFQKKGLSTEHIVRELNKILIYTKPDLIILQVGIVDCSPRVLKNSELNFLKKIPIINSVVHRIIKKYYRQLSSLRNLSYIDPYLFKLNLEQIKRDFKNNIWCVLPIGLPCDAYIHKSPLIAERITIYNEILIQVFGFSLVPDFLYFSKPILNNIYTDDNYHLNENGHHMYSEIISRYLKNANIINF